MLWKHQHLAHSDRNQTILSSVETWELNVQIRFKPQSRLRWNQIRVEFLDTVCVTVCLFKSDFKLSFTPLATNTLCVDVTFRAWLACQHCCTSWTHLSLMLSGVVAEFYTTTRYRCGMKRETVYLDSSTSLQHAGLTLVTYLQTTKPLLWQPAQMG